MMYGVGLADDMLLENWRVMFLICGGGTICAGIIWLTFMPSGPSTAWFLTEEERDIAVRRLAVDHISREQTNFKTSQMWEALKDYRSWFFFIFAFLDTMPSPVIKVRLYPLQYCCTY
jgi:MFS transporter, ACS family, allantoate permease